jgi:hypothetical protein
MDERMQKYRTRWKLAKITPSMRADEHRFPDVSTECFRCPLRVLQKLRNNTCPSHVREAKRIRNPTCLLTMRACFAIIELGLFLYMVEFA